MTPTAPAPSANATTEAEPATTLAPAEDSVEVDVEVERHGRSRPNATSTTGTSGRRLALLGRAAGSARSPVTASPRRRRSSSSPLPHRALGDVERRGVVVVLRGGAAHDTDRPTRAILRRRREAHRRDGAAHRVAADAAGRARRARLSARRARRARARRGRPCRVRDASALSRQGRQRRANIEFAERHVARAEAETRRGEFINCMKTENCMRI